MNAAIRIGVYYALLSGLYIVLSDWAVVRLADGNAEVLTGWQNLKGIAFVAGSAAIMVGLVWHYVRERERVERQREEARQSFEHLFHANPLPVMVHDMDSLQFLAVNRAAVEEYGYPEAEFLALTAPELCSPSDAEKAKVHLARMRPFPDAGQWRHRRRDGSSVEVEIISHPIVFSGRDARLVVATNIGTRAITEQALADAFAAKAEAQEAKTRFLSTISHEMRTPLHAITGSLDLMAREPNEARRLEYAETAQERASDLLALIERLIEAAQLQAQAERREVKEIDLEPFLRRSIDSLSHAAARKNIVLQFVVTPPLPVRARLDATRLEELLHILVGNAIKFSNGGMVELRAELERPHGRPGAILRLHVSDEGIGIPAAHQTRVFESFFQVEQNLTRRYGGVGLGLFVAKQLCDLLRARIELESVDGAGSTFTVSLPGRLEGDDLFAADA